MSRRLVVASLALVLAASMPASAEYVLVLKDGTRLQARSKPQVKGKFVLFTTPTGSPQKILAGDVDDAKTEEANREGLGGAQTLDTPEGRKPAVTPVSPPAGTPTPDIVELSRQRKLSVARTATAAVPTTTPATPPTFTPVPRK